MEMMMNNKIYGPLKLKTAVDIETFRQINMDAAERVFEITGSVRPMATLITPDNLMYQVMLDFSDELNKKLTDIFIRALARQLNCDYFAWVTEAYVAEALATEVEKLEKARRLGVESLNDAKEILVVYMEYFKDHEHVFEAVEWEVLDDPKRLGERHIRETPAEISGLLVNVLKGLTPKK